MAHLHHVHELLKGSQLVHYTELENLIKIYTIMREVFVSSYLSYKTLYDYHTFHKHQSPNYDTCT